MSDQPLSDWPPNLNPQGLAPDEQTNLIHLRAGLDRLRIYEGDFGSALALFDFCETSQSVPPAFRSRWQLVAAREGALAIYHFGKTFELCRASANRCPTVSEFQDHQIARTARKMFEAAFPHVIDVRDAVAHTAEIMHDVDKNAAPGRDPALRQLGIQGGGKTRVMIGSGLAGRTYLHTKDKQTESYVIDRNTLNKLSLVRRKYYAAFRRAEEQLQTAAAKSRGT